MSETMLEKPEAAVPPPPAPSREDEIRARAFLLFLARDGEAGCAEDDWLRAEAEIAALYGEVKSG